MELVNPNNTPKDFDVSRGFDTWSGPGGGPGNWIYRIALISLEDGELTAVCEEPRWAEVEVFAPTAEELAKVAADRLILIEQASACALDALSDNLSRPPRDP